MHRLPKCHKSIHAHPLETPKYCRVQNRDRNIPQRLTPLWSIGSLSIRVAFSSWITAPTFSRLLPSSSSTVSISARSRASSPTRPLDVRWRVSMATREEAFTFPTSTEMLLNPCTAASNPLHVAQATDHASPEALRAPNARVYRLPLQEGAFPPQRREQSARVVLAPHRPRLALARKASTESNSSDEFRSFPSSRRAASSKPTRRSSPAEDRRSPAASESATVTLESISRCDLSEAAEALRARRSRGA